VRILFLSQRIPYPPNRGDKILTWRLVERLSRQHQVTVIAFAHDDGDVAAARTLDTERHIPTIAIPYDERWAKAKALPRLLGTSPLTLGVYGSRALQREVDKRLPGTDLVYGFSSSMGAFTLDAPGVAKVMHFAELDSDKWRQYAEREPFPKSLIYAREHKTLLAFERRLAAECDENVLCTPLEQRIFREQIPGVSSAVLENGVDLAFFAPVPGREVTPGELVFTGVMNYLPNVDGCTFFVREVLPKIRAEVPEAHFTIVGSKPTAEVQALGREPGVTVTGFVDDVRDYLRKAAVSVAPLRIARGIQNKALEAMAMGLPVVGSTSATQGIAGTDGEHYVVADAPDAIAAAVVRLLRDRAAAEALGARARAYVEAHHDWERNFAGVEQIVERAVERRRHRVRL
jgi:sugar transferase (PEP-CTERM/EpsH1 system associated)